MVLPHSCISGSENLLHMPCFVVIIVDHYGMIATSKVEGEAVDVGEEKHPFCAEKKKRGGVEKQRIEFSRRQVDYFLLTSRVLRCATASHFCWFLQVAVDIMMVIIIS